MIGSVSDKFPRITTFLQATGALIGSFVAMVLFVASRSLINVYWPWPNPNIERVCGCFGEGGPLRCIIRDFGGSASRAGLDAFCILLFCVGMVYLFTVGRKRWPIIVPLLVVVFVAIIALENVGLVPTGGCSIME